MSLEKLRKMKVSELAKHCEDKQKELTELRFGVSTGNEKNVSSIEKGKKLIARINTVIREKELAERG